MDDFTLPPDLDHQGRSDNMRSTSSGAWEHIRDGLSPARRAVYGVLLDGRALTASEIGAEDPHTGKCVWKRVGEMVEMGLLREGPERKCRITQQTCITYAIPNKAESMGLSESIFDPARARQDWGTPEVVLNPIYAHFGDIGLDPSGSPHRVLPRTRVTLVDGDAALGPAELAQMYALPGPMTVFLDGLTQSWDGHGLVYCNPPYYDVAPWVYKAAREGDEVILLLPARTGATWWQKWVGPVADVVLFWKGRLKFHGAPAHAAFHSALVYWGARPELFLQAFPGHWYTQNGG